MAETFAVASGFHGEKLYQRRARTVLPILIRQAQAQQPIYYETLAQEVGMPNPRNLNYPLGCIGDALNGLASDWESEIPHIQALVLNQQTGLPGPGFDGFLKDRKFKWSNPVERRAVIKGYWAQIYAYPYWSDVLQALGLAPTPNALGQIIERAGHGGGGGEGPAHLRLKTLVSKNPDWVGLKIGSGDGEVEQCLPSGDSVDVVFFRPNRIHAVEVKPVDASVRDITRGLFQCVKYRAVLQARAAFEHDDRRISACLALGGPLPVGLIPLRNSLSVEVFEGLDEPA
jgi:hypothetical protein